MVRVTFGRIDFLLTGDIACDTEDEILARGYNVTAEVLKVGHHGSRFSSCDALLDATRSRIGVISVGGNQHGHPTSEALERLETHGLEIYRTDLHGDVGVATDGAVVTVTTARREEPEPSGPNVLISHIQYDPPGTDRGDNLVNEWVELTNRGDQAADLTGWWLEDEAGHRFEFPVGFALAHEASVKIRTGSGTDTATDLYWGRGTAVWNNDGDASTLYRSDGSVAAAEAY